MSTFSVLPSRCWPVFLGSLAVLSGCRNDRTDAVGACASGLLPGDLVITEIMADPPGADSGREWFEVYNASGLELDLLGTVLLRSREDGTDAKIHRIRRSWVLPPEGYGVAGGVLDEDDVLALVPHVDYGYEDGLGDMGNSSGRLAIACDEDVIDDAIYVEPSSGAARGFTGDRAPDAIANDDLALWCDASSELDAESLGTPGEPNDICVNTGGPLSCIENGTVRPARAPTLGDVVITEVMANPEASEETDGEWFELYIGADIDLNGLAVGTDETGAEADPVASNECLPVAAGTRLVFAREADPTLNGDLPQVDAAFTFSLRNSDGQLVVSYGGEVLDVLAYGSTPAGASLNLDPDFRSPEGNDDERYLCPSTTAYGAGDLGTPGGPNEECAIPPPEGQCLEGEAFRAIVAPLPGDLVITELMPNPSAVGDTEGEWIELRANAAFDLNGLELGRAEGVADSVVETEACLPLVPGDHVLFAREADEAVNGGLPPVDGLFDFSLVNSDGTLWVGHGGATLDVATWPSSSSGAARSLDPAAADPAANDDDAAWCDALTPYGAGDLGTPGEPNPACGGIPTGTCSDGGTERDIVRPQLGDLVITELMANPDVVTDANGEWFEVLVLAPVDLNGLEFGDDPANPDATLPVGGDCLAAAAGERVLFARSADPLVNGGLPPVLGTFGFGLTNAGGTLFVGLEGRALDTITWSSSPTGASSSLDPAAENPVDNDVEANFCPSTEPYGDGDLGTPGAVGPAC
ncbi:MAG: lamin tail domain-containing protein [Myxococcales bacterium]|nr:lamin tail domain-containing protein [Myxococcales bacterium]